MVNDISYNIPNPLSNNVYSYAVSDMQNRIKRSPKINDIAAILRQNDDKEKATVSSSPKDETLL